MPSEPHALYRFWDSRDGLLYVGITANPGVRWGQHAGEKPWWTQVEKVTLEWFPDRESVLAAERRAIQTERPAHNVSLKPRFIQTADGQRCASCGTLEEDSYIWAQQHGRAARPSLKANGVRRKGAVKALLRQAVLDHCRSEDEVGPVDVMEATGLSESTVHRFMREAVDDGWLARVGHGMYSPRELVRQPDEDRELEDPSC